MKSNYLFILITIILMLVMAHSAFANGQLKVGIDLVGEQDFLSGGASATENVDFGLSLGAEFFSSINKNVDAGGGIVYQVPRKISNYDGDAKFNFIPLYGALRLRFTSEPTSPSPYVVIQLGYNLFFGNDGYRGDGTDLEGGEYVGFGGGIIFNEKYAIELHYSENNGTADMGEDIGVKYTKFALNFCYLLNSHKIR